MRNHMLFAVMAFVLTAASATAADPATPRTITASGSASIKAVPDHARIDIGVDTSDRVTVKAVAANSVLMAKVVDAIKAVGIPEKAIQTSRFSIEAQHPTQKDGYSQDLTVTLGYAVSNILIVEVDDVSKVPLIIDASVKAGANSSNSVTFEAKNRQALEDKVLADAVKDARHNAEIAAAAEGAKVGKPVSIRIGAGDFYEFMKGRITNAAPAYAGSPAPVIMPGRVDVMASVTIEFALE